MGNHPLATCFFEYIMLYILSSDSRIAVGMWPEATLAMSVEHVIFMKL